MQFASDNTSGAHPTILEALASANGGYVPGYGNDPLTADVQARLREVFEAPEAAVYLVATGTAANALSLACFCPPWAGVYCHRNAHIEEDECGAPEFYTGGSKMVLVDGPHGKIAPEALAQALTFAARAGVHNVQRGMVSLTNTTEAGTVYSPDEVAELTALARTHDLPVHMDGARIANALVATGASPAQMTWKAGVDVLSFGGTKNGCMGVEAVILFDPEKAWEFELRRKRAGQLASKYRFLSAQMAGYLKDDLWMQLASAANAAAARLSEGILKLPGASLMHPTQANAVFPALPRRLHKRAFEAGATYYLWPGHQSLDGPDDEFLTARMVCSWSTTPEDVDAFLSVIGG